ncbi:MAG TPA: DUF3077 domain-containing protein [Rhodanobacteraceae bacterium]|nr:DUF3077 domain-containing protein [Rhodanobacteraceae bacterium]
MALQIVQQASNRARGNLQTQATGFCHSPELPEGMFEVRAGVPAVEALQEAANLASAIRKLTNLHASGMDCETTYIVSFLVDVVESLIVGVQHDIEFNE